MNDHRSPMRIRLSDERRRRLLASVKQYFEEHFDESLSDFRADGLVDFLIGEIGPPVYNQAIHDAYGFMQEKLMDMEGEVYEPDNPASR